MRPAKKLALTEMKKKRSGKSHQPVVKEEDVSNWRPGGFKIIWSSQARDDLRDIVTFIAANNPPAAESFGFRLMAKVDMLEQFPEIGRIVPEEQNENIREIISPPYRIIYRVLAENHVVAIARVWHSARGEPEISSRVEY
jgi:toxin ParE1/3/4